MSPLHFYDAAIQLARNSAQPLSEEEYEIGMGAAQQIEQWCDYYPCNRNVLTQSSVYEIYVQKCRRRSRPLSLIRESLCKHAQTN